MKKTIAIAFILLGIQQLIAQETFTRKDSLQGGLRFERTCFDVRRYDLNVKINPTDKSLTGFNDITFNTVENTNKIQLDLFENMLVDSIVFNKKKLNYKREFNAVFIDFPSQLQKGSENKIRFYYSGKPLPAKRAPWDGGFDWKEDTNGKPWIAVAVQGTGASLWYPCKDSQTDEPDNGATIKVAAPNGLTDVSNGRLIGSEDLKNGYTRWDWEVKNPINNYDITVNIGDYVHFHDSHNGLDLDYYVLSYNEEKAKKQFEQVKPMLDCFESKFGKYPFAEDSYKLVETPYLGMEHQSAVAYGNKYMKGYLGGDSSGTGIGLLFDYIIVHESGHEWFGNSITSKDIADMWIHEGFTTYSESVYIECLYGYDKAMEYISGKSKLIRNAEPVIAKFGVNNEGPQDIYYKGAAFLNTLRHVVGDDDKWWKMLLKYCETYKHKIIDTETVCAFFSKESAMDLKPLFDQYLRTTNIPVLSLSVKKNKVTYSWGNVSEDFNMPVDIEINSKKVRLYPKKQKQEYAAGKITAGDVKVLKDNFLIDVINY
ncbi:MAG TPA: M1 family metallopeptidase [Flavobacterium sp.]|nr:M1 family metallopeptidase [Flavobacterium sp.]